MRLMQRMTAFCTIAVLGILSGGSAHASDAAKTIEGRNGIELPAPPATATGTVTEDFHGTEIKDPYRWLEDAKSPQTRAWIDSQIRYTEEYLSQIKIREQIVADLTKLQRVEIGRAHV